MEHIDKARAFQQIYKPASEKTNKQTTKPNSKDLQKDLQILEDWAVKIGLEIGVGSKHTAKMTNFAHTLVGCCSGIIA